MFKTLTKVLAQRVVYGRESHAVLLHPDKLEVAWWTTKGINVVDMSLKDFAARLLQHE